MKKGFTLLELLVVVAILGIVMVAITQLLASVLSNSGKSAASQSVKSSGQFALAMIQKTLRRAKSASCTANSLTAVVAETSGDVTYTFTWVGNPTWSLNKTDSISGIPSTVNDSTVQVTAFECTLLRSGTGSSPTLIWVNLTLSKSGISSDQRAVSQDFGTTVSLRTY